MKKPRQQLLRDLINLNAAVDRLLAKETSDGLSDKHIPSELEKLLILIKRIIAKIIEILTTQPKDKKDEKRLKKVFKALGAILMKFLMELELLFRQGKEKSPRYQELLMLVRAQKQRLSR